MGSPRPMLFLVIDAVPFDVAWELWDDGLMPGFQEPRPLISVFPSLTHVAVPSLIQGVFERRPPGYEARYFHPPSGEIRGGLADPTSESVFDPYQLRPRGALGQLAIYVLTRALAYGQVRWCTWRFQRGGGPWLGYIAATDGVAHFEGREALRTALIDIFAEIAAVREEYHRREGVLPGVVTASDHGMYFGTHTHVDTRDMEKMLVVSGFTPGRQGRKGVHLVPLGDVGGGGVWCAPDSAAEVAEVIAHVTGVGIAFSRDGDGARVYSVRNGLHTARLRWESSRYLYEPEQGDPLTLAPLWRELGGGWIEERDLLAHSWNHAYPWAPIRVRRGLTDLVEWPAQVLFSMEDGYTYGPNLVYAATLLRGGQVGSHGGLTRAQSTAFAATTEDRPDTGPLRPEQVFAPWAELVRLGSTLPQTEGAGE